MKEEPLHKLEVVNLLAETGLWEILDLHILKVRHVKQENFECVELVIVLDSIEGKWIIGTVKVKTMRTVDYESLASFLKEIQDGR